MSASHRTQCGVFSRSFAVLLALATLLIPQAVRAESLLLLYKEDTSKTSQLYETIRQNTKQPTVFSLNGNGNLVVKYGSMRMFLAYSPPEELHKQQQEPIRLAMSINQETPAPSGISVRFNFTF